MPTTSLAVKNFCHASRVVPAPVSVRMPRAIISRTTSSLAWPFEESTHLSDFTVTTRPGYGPGIPGIAAGAYFETTRSVGRSLPACSAGMKGAVASNRKMDLRCMVTPPGPDPTLTHLLGYAIVTGNPNGNQERTDEDPATAAVDRVSP